MDLTIDRLSNDKIIPAFSQAFTRLLIPVNGYFPVDAFRDLQERLSVGTDEKEFIRFKELAVNYLNRAVDKKEDIAWIETLLFLSLYQLEERLDTLRPWADGFKSVSFSEMASPARLVCSRILNLYRYWTASSVTFPCARPYAFYLLMEVVQGSRSLLAVMEMTGNEFVQLKDFIAIMNGMPDAPILEDNELIKFSKKYRENQSLLGSATPFDREFAVRNYTKILRENQDNINLSKGMLADERLVAALVVGSTGSGKTVMIKSIFQRTLKGEMYYDNPLKSIYVKTYPEGNEAQSFLVEGRPAPTASTVWALEGKIRISKTLYNIQLTDTRGGAITSTPEKKVAGGEEPGPLEQALMLTDLLIITLEPINLLEANRDYTNLLNGLGARLDDLFRNSKHAMVSIVLTKFDEYGVVISGPRSLLNTEAKWEKLRQFQDNASEMAWEVFVEEVLSGFNDNMPLRYTLGFLLQKIKPLLTQFCNTHRHLPINIYITNAIEAKDAISFQRTGIPYLFSDFEAYASCLIEKFPQQSAIGQALLPPVQNLMVAGTPDNSQPEAIRITWDAVPGFQYLIKKKVGFNNGVWTSWLDDFAANISSNTYTDRQHLKKGNRYQYQVIAVQTDNKQRSDPAESEVFVIPPIKIPWVLVGVISGLLLIALVVWFA